MALYPAPDMRTGAISLWVAGAEEAARAAQIVRELGHVVSVVAAGDRRMTRFEPAGPLRGTLHAAARQVDLAPRRAARRDGRGRDPDRELPRLRRHAPRRWTPSLRSAPRSTSSGAATARRRCRSTGVGPPRRRARGRSTSATRARCCACCPGWLAGQPEGAWTLDGDESIRRRPVDRVAEPLRLMGADDRVPRRAPAAAAGRRRGAARDRVRAAGRQRPGEVVRAARRPARRGRDQRDRAAPTRDHTERMLRAAGAAVRTETAGTPVTIHGELPATPGHGRARRAAGARLDQRPRRLLLGRLLHRRGAARARQRGAARGGRHQPDRIGLLGILDADGRGGRGDRDARRRQRAARRRSSPARGRCRATRVGGGEVPLAIDELPLVALAGCFAEGETVVSRGRGAAPQGVGPDRDRGRGARRRSGPTIEATEDGFAVEGTGGLRGGALDAAGDHRLAMLGAVAGLASREGVEVRGMEAAAVSYPGFEARPRVAQRELSLSPVATGGPRRARARAPAAGARPRSRETSWRSFGSKTASSPGPPATAIAAGLGDLDRPADHQQPGALVDLMLREALARAEVDHDRTALVVGGEDLRAVARSTSSSGMFQLSISGQPILTRPW